MSSEERSIRNIVVLGGGTAGWLTALYAKATLPEKKITVIESEEIGILGAGEGSTPHLVSVMDVINIPVSDLVKNTGCTLKSGITFKNWSKERPGNSYTHPFALYQDFNVESSSVSTFVSSNLSLLAAGMYLDGNLNQGNVVHQISSMNKIPFVYDEALVNQASNRIFDYHHIGNFGIHFDARKLADFLKNTALSRGIERVEGILEDVERDDTGDVKKLILKDGSVIDSDFVFDCSGFRRFFPKLFESEWVDYTPYLPVNAALPFFLPIDEQNIPIVTESIAMDYGWMWKIPLQHRYGCGYVFDESLISEEEAKAEVEKYVGHEIEPLKTLRFNAGYYKTPWVNNVMSIGLSAGFIEPLEATSIWSSIQYMGQVLTSPHLMYSRDPRIAEDFNKYACELNDEIAAFVNFHYLGQRDDTDFWKKFTKENCVPSLKKYLDILDYREIKARDINSKVWEIASWYYVAEGIDYPLFREWMEKYYFYNNFRNMFKNNYMNYKALMGSIPELATHKEVLENLKKTHVESEFTQSPIPGITVLSSSEEEEDSVPD